MSLSPIARIVDTGDVVRVVLAENTPDARRVGRSLAQKAAGTPIVGPNAVTTEDGVIVMTFRPTYTARKVTRNVPTVAELSNGSAISEADEARAEYGPKLAKLLAKFGTLTHEDRSTFLVLIGAASKPPVADAVKAVKVNPFKRGPVTCETCQDLGYVRAMGDNAGKPYKTANGAAAALAGGRAKLCTAKAHKGAKRSA